jgi:hypothetical protein
MAAFDSHLHRRAFLQLAGAAALSASAAQYGRAAEELIGRLIGETRGMSPLSRRIDVISRALLGKRYRADTLIGGPRQPEVFVARDDVFDCVTYCETVLAAAKAHDLGSFERELRAIRYHRGVVAWQERNHDFAAWCARNVENGLCAPVALGAPVALKKVMTYPRALGTRTYEIAAATRGNLLAERGNLRDGDIVGFVSRRAGLDYYHCGFVMVGDKGEFLLRHASQSHRRVMDAAMERFLATNRVAYVTVLRPRDETEKKT